MTDEQGDGIQENLDGIVADWEKEEQAECPVCGYLVCRCNREDFFDRDPEPQEARCPVGV